jgi:NTP pyrophosphatase (non-canonical NTP hydrolase)
VDSLGETLGAILKFRDERDWAQFHTPRHLGAAMAIEAGELQQVMLWKSDEEVAATIADSGGRKELAREVADVLIFALLFCHAIGVDPITTMREKIQENAEKYPVRLAKGQAAKYTQLRRDDGE